MNACGKYFRRLIFFIDKRLSIILILIIDLRFERYRLVLKIAYRRSHIVNRICSSPEADIRYMIDDLRFTIYSQRFSLFGLTTAPKGATSAALNAVHRQSFVDMIRKIINKQNSNDITNLNLQFSKSQTDFTEFCHWHLEFEIYLGFVSWDLGCPFRFTASTIFSQHRPRKG